MSRPVDVRDVWVVVVGRAVALFGITWLSLNGLVDAIVDMRGGSDYVRPFHSWNMAFCAAASVLLFEILLGCFRVIRRFPWAMQALGFVHIVLIVTFFALPLGDFLAVQREKSRGAPILSDQGYGWYYWDDSGMGGDPITGSYMLFFLMQPLKLGVFVGSTAAVFVLANGTRAREPRYSGR